MVYGDMPEFVTVDGTRISGRVAYNEYCKRNGVTNPADFTKVWEGNKRERERFFEGGKGYDRERRIEHLKRNYDKLSRRR